MYFIWINLLEQYQITSQLSRKTLKDIPSRSWYFDECHNDAPLCTVRQMKDISIDTRMSWI